MRRNGPARVVALAAIVAMLAVGGACGDDDDAAPGSASGTPSGTLRLGYFPNVTHAPALIGVERGFFAKALGPQVKLETSTFNAGPEVVEAIFNEALDAAFIGPNPAINAYAKSRGEAIRIVAGSTSGGAFLVVKPGIKAPADLRGKTVATPQLGNTQDVALRAWLEEHGLGADTAGGGDVAIRPQANADTLTAFQSGEIDGAWVPEPWATRLIQEAGGEVLVDEKDLWPGGRFVTTHVIVRTEYLEENPAVVKGLLQGLFESINFANVDAAQAQTSVNDEIERITTKRLSEATISGAWSNLSFTWDPIASSLEESKNDAVAVGLLEPVDLEGIYDLKLLNEVLASNGQPTIGAP